VGCNASSFFFLEKRETKIQGSIKKKFSGFRYSEQCSGPLQTIFSHSIPSPHLNLYMFAA